MKPRRADLHELVQAAAAKAFQIERDEGLVGLVETFRVFPGRRPLVAARDDPDRGEGFPRFDEDPSALFLDAVERQGSLYFGSIGESAVGRYRLGEPPQSSR